MFIIICFLDNNGIIINYLQINVAILPVTHEVSMYNMF